MLSTEAPPDLPCPCVISQRKSDSSNLFSIDVRDSDINQQQLESDLFISDPHGNNPLLTKFSIRNYVSGARGKDIKTNWPFSQKNLQLCLKHGLTDVLPPFQPLDIVRNPSRMKCVDVKLPGVNHNIVSSGFQEEKEYQSATSHSYTNINLIPPIRTPCSKPEAVNLPRTSMEKPESSAQASGRVKKSTQNPVKNCKMIVKLSKITDPLSNEYSEPVASKVCPVCKTFSSSSNTTLNAHIDQCLSGVSTMDWASNSKVSKHRIKPRKMRLMVDIYATALHCTLEDLDKRNGTNWASNMVFSSQGLEECAKEKKKKKIDLSSDVEGKEEGAVYVDSSGTKFLSLSKCSDLAISNKESTIFLRKKKRVLVKKHKPLKHSHHGQTGSCPGPSHRPEVNNVQQKKLFRETQPVKAYDQIKCDEMGMIKQWAGSKRTGFRMISDEHENQSPDKTAKNLSVKGSVSSRGDSCIKGTSDSNLPYTSHNECMKQHSPRKRAGLSMTMSEDCHGKRNHLVLRKCNVKQSRKDIPLVHKRHTDQLNGTENLDFSRSNKSNEINASMALNAECSFSNSRVSHQHAFSSGGKDLAYSRQPPLDHVISPGGKKLSSRKKLSVTHASLPDSKDDSRRRHLNFKKPRLHYTSESDDEAVVPRSAICRRDNQVEELCVNAAQLGKIQSSMKQAKVLIIQKKGVFLNSGKEVDMASMGSEISPESDSHGVRKNVGSFIGGGVPASKSNVLDAVKEAEIQDEFVCELVSERADGEAYIAFSKSLDSSFYNRHCPAELLLGGEPEMFYADKFAENMASSDTQTVADMDANEGQGNYFVDVDPIPIPGPPGSFLPSPGHMSSEELQGNSSLTTCRIQSSEDKHELMEMDSSDSPMSSASPISESIAGTSDSLSVKNLSELSDGIRHQSQCNIFENRVVETSNLSEFASCVERKLDLDDSRADLMLTAIKTHIFKNSQPSSGKGSAFLNDSFDCQESQLLRRRSIDSLALPAQEKCISGDLTEMAYNFNVRSQTPPGKVPTPEAEKYVSNSHMVYAPMPVSQNSETKSPTCGDCESPSPSTTNPVLRLMGKNLMVVNKDETSSPQTRPTHLSMAKDDHPSVLSNVDNGVTTAGFLNEYYPVHQTLSRVPSMFDHMQHFAASSSDCFENTANIRMQGSSQYPSTFMLSSNSVVGSLACPLERHEYAGGRNQTSEFGSNIGTNTAISYGVEKVQTHFHQLVRTTDFSGYKSKEILVDESQKSEPSEPGLAIKATHGEAKMEARGSTVWSSASVAFEHATRHVNPAFYIDQTRGYPLCNGSQAFYTPNIQMPSSKGIIRSNSVQWNCTREGSAILHPNSLTGSSSAAGHPRSSLYFSPGFS